MTARDDACLEAGREALRAAGIADDETAPATLLPLAGRSPELDRALVERLGRTPTDDRAVALRALATGAEERGWRAVAKAARRALYLLGQRGVAVPAPPAPSGPALPRALEPALEGYVSAIDGRGDRLVWLVRPRREGGLLVLTSLVNEPGGLRDVAIAQLARKELARMRRDLATRHGLRLVPADGAYCDALLAEAFERARARAVQGIGEYPAYRARMLARPVAPLAPPLATRVLAPDEVASPAAVARSAALLDEPEFASWLVDRAALAPYLEEMTAARESPLLLTRPQQQERIERVIGRALRELFIDTGGAAYRRRLEEMAYYLQASDRPVLAVAAAAAAAALAASTHGGEGIPFFEALVRRSIAAHANEDARRAEREAGSSLLVKPSPALASHPPPGRPR